MKTNQGYLYIASGKGYISESIESVKSLRDCKHAVHVTLITDTPTDSDIFDEVILMDSLDESEQPWKKGILFKVSALKNTPYQKTFFVDTDTFFTESCEELFELLNFYDLLIAQAPSDPSKIYHDKKPVEGYLSYNTGVIVFNKNERVNKLLENWLNIYQNDFELYPHDQGPFMASLITSKVYLYVLQPIYNFRLPFFVSLPALKVKLIHGRTNDYKRIEKLVNRKLKNRVWNPEKEKIYFQTQAVKIGPVAKMKKNVKRVKKMIKKKI